MHKFMDRDGSNDDITKRFEKSGADFCLLVCSHKIKSLNLLSCLSEPNEVSLSVVRDV